MATGVKWFAALTTVLLCLGLGAPQAMAATLSGTISNEKASPIKGIEVRLWNFSKKFKAWVVLNKTKSDVSGKYKFTGIKADTYKLDARLAAGVTGWYGDRWYDVAQPTSKGYISDNADQIPIKATDNLTGYNITLQEVGGLNTQVAQKSGLMAGIQVRCEQKTEFRIHHNDFSKKAPHLGKVYFLGLPPSDYRLMFHGPDGKYETLVVPGPYKVVSKKIVTAKKATLLAMATDPYEPNNSPADKGSELNSDIFHLSTPKPFTSNGALIGPRSSGDVDWYCFAALAADRYIVTADMPLKVEGKIREDPWVDPVVALYSVTPKTNTTTLLKTDDDGGAGKRDAKLDTGVLGADGRYCLAVTTFGDTTWTGKNQMSAGRYRLTIKMGNRRPVLTVKHQGATFKGSAPTVTPQSLTVKEGQKLKFELDFSDVDRDTLTATMSHKDAKANVLTSGAFKTDTGTPIPKGGGSFSNGKGAAVFTWETSETAAKNSPYTLSFDVKDAEFTSRVTFTIKVEAVNHPPSVPKLKAPPYKSTVSTATPTVEVYNSTDVDGDTLTYDFEVYYKAPGGTPAESKSSVVEGTTFSAFTLAKKAPENTWVFWRARANDGNATANYSPWTSYFLFLVNSNNEPPTTPTLLKPQDNEVVLTQQPTLSAQNPTDPENDAITLRFQVASDKGFTIGVIDSPDVAMNITGTSTMWTLTTPLAWDGTYFARVYAKDSHGAQSGYSYVNTFKVRPNPSGPDKGPPPADAGMPDAAPPVQDKGPGAPDTGTGGGEEEGCACTVSNRGATGGVVWLLGLAALLWWRRRR